MRKIVFLLVFMTTAVAFAQSNYHDVVYLKNGSIIRGVIIEQIPNESLKIETADGSLFVFKIDEVEKMTKERIDASQQTATAPQQVAPASRTTVSPPMQQEPTPARKSQFGVKGGLNTASEMASDGDNSSQTDARIGIHLGFFMELPLSAKIDFQPELVYSMQGGSVKYGGYTITDKIDYINLPLMFKFYVWKQRLSIDAGPQLGYMISAKVSAGGESESIYDDLNKFDISLALGLSYKLTDRIDLGLRGVVGFTNLYEGDDYDYTNSVGQLSVAFRF